MTTTECGDLLLKFDRRDRAILSGARGANIDGTDGDVSSVELVGDRRPMHHS